MINRFWLGLRAPIEGLKIIKSENKLKMLSAIPVLITIILITVGFVQLNKNFDDLLIYFLGTKYLEYNNLIQTVIRFFSFAFFGLLVLIASYFLASILSIPVNSIIAIQSLLKLGALNDKKLTLGESVKTFFSMLKVSAVKGVLFLILSVLIFIGSLLPGFALPMLYLGLLLLAYDCIDFSLEALELNLPQRIQFFKTHIPEISGFALFLGVVFFVPVLNVVLLPVAISGGAFIVKETYDKNKQHKNDKH